MLLRVLDYLASPFGTKEWELMQFGVEGVRLRPGEGRFPGAHQAR